MNRYGRMAQEHWRRWLPTRYREIPDPNSFFTTLGWQVEERIVTLSTDIAGDDPPGDGYLDRVGRLNMARLQAEEAQRPDPCHQPQTGVLFRVSDASELVQRPVVREKRR